MHERSCVTQEWGLVSFGHTPDGTVSPAEVLEAAAKDHPPRSDLLVELQIVQYHLPGEPREHLGVKAVIRELR